MCMYIYTHVFVGPLALGVVRSQQSILYPNLLKGFNPSLCPSPGRSWGLKLVSRGLVVASLWPPDVTRSLLELSKGVPEAPCWLMLAHVGVMLAQGGPKVAPRCLKIALYWLKLAPRRPKWPPKDFQSTPR